MKEGSRQARRWFERYLRDHGYEYVREPRLGREAHVDLLVRRGGVEFVCAIRGFEEPHPIERRFGTGGLVVPTDVMYGPMRAVVDDAAGQLEPLAGSPWPLLVVLANPLHFYVPLTISCVAEAINDVGGERTYLPEVPVTKGFELRSKHPHISAVVMVSERSLLQEHFSRWHNQWRKENPRVVGRALDNAWAASPEAASPAKHKTYLVELLATGSPQTVPVRGSVFDGPRDCHAELVPHRETRSARPGAP